MKKRNIIILSIVSIVFYLIGSNFGDFDTRHAYLEGTKYEVHDYWGFPNLLYDDDPSDGWRSGILCGVKDVYWNDKYVFATLLPNWPHSCFFIIETLENDYICSDSLTEEVAMEKLRELNIDLSQLNHVDITSDSYASKIHRKQLLLLLCSIALASLCELLFSKVIKPKFRKHK